MSPLRLSARLALLALLFATPASAAVTTVTVVGEMTKPAGSSPSALDPCIRCLVSIEYVGTNDLTAESLVVSESPVLVQTDDDGDWTTDPLGLLAGGNYRFRYSDPEWPQAGIFLDVTKTACASEDYDADGDTVADSCQFSALTVVNTVEGADVSALDHGLLSGLSDGPTDHPELAALADNETVTGTWTFSTAPSGITWSSVTGKPSTFAPEGHTIASHSDTSATGAELETLTDGSNADSLHSHDTAAGWTLTGSTTASGANDVTVGASASIDAGTGTVDAAAYTVGGTALASTDLSDSASITKLGATIEESEISDLSHLALATAGSAGTNAANAGTASTAARSDHEHDHADLSNIGTDDHHARYTDAEALAYVKANDGPGSLIDADTVDGAEAAALEESAEIDSDIATHAAIASAHHTKTSNFSELSGEATDAQVSDTLTVGSAGSVDDAALSATVTKLGSDIDLSTSEVTGTLPLSSLEDGSTTTHALFAGGGGGDPSYRAIADGDIPSAIARDSELHSAVTMSGTPDYITLSGQDIVRGQVDLTTDITGDLPVASVADGASGQLIVQGASTPAWQTMSGDATLSAAGALSLADDVVAADELADGDLGDVSVSGGVVSLDADTVGADEIASSGVTPGSYTHASITVDGDGRVSSASSGTDDDSPDDDSEVPDAITVGVGGTVAAAATVSIEAAEISDADAGTDITADLEEETHASEHENGGADEISVAGLSGTLGDPQTIDVTKDAAATIGTRSKLNFTDTGPISVTVADNSGSGRVDIDIDCPTCQTSAGTLDVQEGDASVAATADTLDFGAGFDVTETPSGEANVVLDYTEDPVDLSTGEVTGTLPAGSVGNGLTDAQVVDTLTVDGGSVADNSLSSNVELKNATWTKSTGVQTFAAGTIEVAADEWDDADVSNNITSDLALQLTGGTMTGNIAFSGTETVDGIDISAHAVDASAHHTKTTSASELTSGTIPDAQLPSEAMLSDTAETVTAVHTYSAKPAFNASGGPFTVTDSTEVTNLNAQYVGGELPSAFADASHAHAGSDITSGTVGATYIDSAITRDTEWDTLAEINAATTDDDALGLTDSATLSGDLTLTGAIDAGGATSMEVPNSTALPATCAVGDLYMDTDATSGQRLYLCESANTWALQGDGDGGSTTLDVAYNNEGGTGNRSVTVDDGNVKLDLSDAANDYHLVVDNTSTGAIARGIQVMSSGVGGTTTIALDVSDADIGTAVALGSNDITTTASTLASTELDVLDDGLDPTDMDDNDWGDFTAASGVFTLDADVVAAAEMADADHGDVAWSGGVASVEATAADAVTQASLADDAVGPAELEDTDFGDFSGSADVFTLDADVVAAAEMADADHGDISWTGGVASIDDDVVTAADFADGDWGDVSVATNSVTLDADVVGSAEMADEDHGDVAWSGGAASVEDVSCADCIDGAELADTIQADSTLLEFQVGTANGSDILFDIETSASGEKQLLVELDQSSSNSFEVYTEGFASTPLFTINPGASRQLSLSATTSGTTFRTFDVQPGSTLTGGTGGFEFTDDTVTLGASDSILKVDANKGSVTHSTGSSLIGLIAASGGADGIDASDADLAHAIAIGPNSIGTDSGDVTAAELAILSGRTASGSDAEIVTGTAGTSGNCAQWNVDGDLVDAGATCGGGTIAVEEGDASVDASTGTLDFGPGFDVTSSPSGEANVVLDLTEDQVDLTAEVTGELPDANVADALTLAGGTIGTSAITLVQGAAPTPTAEGVIEWETDDDHIIVGDGASQVEFVPAEDVSGDVTMTDAGVVSLSADVVGSAEMADEDHGDVSWSGGVASIDSAVVGRTEIDETLLSVQTHATDCTALTCDAGSDGEPCFEQDDDAWYVCDGSGSPAWVAVGGSAETNDLEATDPPTVADDEVYVGDGAGSGVFIALADSDGAGQKLVYDTATNAFSAGTDDDVPESGDFGNAADLEATGALSADVVAAAEMADADHGDVSWSSGVATVENLQCATCVSPAEVLGSPTDEYLLSYEATGTTWEWVDPSTLGVTDHGALSGLADDDHSLYLRGDASDTYSTDLVISANTSDASDSLSMTMAGGGAADIQRGGYVAAYGNEDAKTGEVEIFSGDVSGGDVYIKADTPDGSGTVTLAAFDNGASSTAVAIAPNGLAYSTGDWYLTDVLGIGGVSAGAAACISNDSSDRLFHDTDCDDSQDAGENYIDTSPTRDHEEWFIPQTNCQELSTGGATEDASDETGSNIVAFGDGFIFPDASDTSITCIVPLPASFNASGAVEIQLRGHTEGAQSGAGDIDFEIQIKEIADGEAYGTTAWSTAEATSAGELDIAIGSFAADISERSSWFTITETLVAEDELVFKLTRDGDDGTHDDKNQDFRLDRIGVRWQQDVD